MFNNLNRLRETVSSSLADAQEKTKQQRLARERDLDKSRSPTTNQALLFVADNEEDPDDQSGTADGADGVKVDGQHVSKEMAAKLVKLEKYEARHPRLIQAYKANEAIVEAFERILRDKTPLISIKEPEEFSDYLENLKKQAELSHSELLRVTEELQEAKQEKIRPEASKSQELEEECRNLQQQAAGLENQLSEIDQDLRQGISNLRAELVVINADNSASQAEKTIPSSVSRKKKRKGKKDKRSELDIDTGAKHSDLVEDGGEVSLPKPDFSHFEEALESAKEDERARIEEIESLSEMLKSVGGELVEAKESLKEKMQRLEGANSQIDEINSQLSSTRTQMEELETLREFKQRSEANEKLYAEAGKKNASTIEEFRRSATEADLELRSTKDQLNAQQIEVRNLQHRLEDWESLKKRQDDTIRSQRTQIQKLEFSCTDYQTVETRLREDLQKFRKNTERMNSQLGTLESIRMQLSNKNADLTEELAVARSKANSAYESMENLREESRELWHRTRDSEGRAESLEEELKDINRLLSERSRDCTTMRDLIGQTEVKLSEAETNHRSVVSHLGRDLDATVAQLATAKADCQRHMIASDDLQAKITSLREVESNLSKNEELLAETNNKCHHLEQKASTLQQDLASCQNRVDKRVEDIDHLSKEYAIMESNYEKLQQKARQTEVTADQLRSELKVPFLHIYDFSTDSS